MEKNTHSELKEELIQEVKGEWVSDQEGCRVRMMRHEWESNHHPAVISNQQK